MTALMVRPEGVTPGWLTAVLGSAGARVRAVTAEPIGHGKMSRCLRFHLDWTPAGAGVASVVGKFAAADPAHRRAALDARVHQRELYFYRELAPHADVPVPTLHFGADDPDSGEFALLLSDLRSSRQVDQLDGGDPVDIAAALGVLPALHAPWWGADLAAVPRPDQRRLAAAYHLLTPRFLARFGTTLSAGAAATIERFAAAARAWTRLDVGPHTVLHNDFRLDNLLFGSDGAVTVLDWQTITIGPAAADVATLVGGSMRPEVRRRHEDGLVAGYLAALRAKGIEPDRADFDRAYRVHTLAGLHMAVVGGMLAEPDPRGDELFVTMAERHAAHAADAGAFDLVEAR